MELRNGSVSVFRQDKRDVTPQQVEALSAFSKDFLCPSMVRLKKYVLKEYGEKENYIPIWMNFKRMFVKDYMCREKFEPFFEKMKAEKIAAGDGDWEFATSPYENFPTFAEAYGHPATLFGIL